MNNVLIMMAAALLAATATAAGGKEAQMDYRELTPEEERVIVHKGTERPFSGTYHAHFEAGTYECRRCGAALYRSEDKFKSGCGWPSFDDEIAGAVRREPDADGRRTEILCAACGGHLGHVFTGEGFTGKDTRHCVNSVALEFVPGETDEADATRKAYFAGGCFWGVEALLEELPGVQAVTSGYMGGRTSHPTYEQVCGGRTGHAETVEVRYDPRRIDYETLAKAFFEIHDPTQRDRQGPDIGSQYRSAVFVATDEEQAVVENLIGILRGTGLRVVTEVNVAGPFWPAEDDHQDYYRRTGKEPYCHRRIKRFP